MNSQKLDYREILSSAYERRVKVNPKYSMRAFARDIELSPSRLSEVFSGKSGDLSLSKAKFIAKKLNLSTKEKALFLDLIESSNGVTKEAREAALSRAQIRQKSMKSSLIDDNQFQHISDPIAVALWCYLKTQECKNKTEEICKVFKLNLIEGFALLKRLEKVKLVQREGDVWIATDGTFSVGDEIPQSYIREFHKKISSMGANSILNMSNSERHLDSMVISFNKERFEEARNKISEFVHSMIQEFDEAESNSVYAMSLQFFPIWKNNSSTLN